MHASVILPLGCSFVSRRALGNAIGEQELMTDDKCGIMSIDVVSGVDWFRWVPAGLDSQANWCSHHQGRADAVPWEAGWVPEQTRLQNAV